MILSTIEEALDTIEPRISWKDIANAAGITNSALSHFKKGTELKFPTLLKIAKFIFKNKYFSTFKSWCINFQQPMNIRYAMEFLAVNKLIDELEELIKKVLKLRPNQELVEWTKAYKIQIMYLRREPTAKILNEIRLFSPKSVEIKVLMNILDASCKNRFGDYDSMASVVDGLMDTLDEIDEDFVKESYSIRVKELLAYVNLFTYNKPEVARSFAEEIISSDFCATLTAHSYYIVGMSYLFTNYDECLGNIMRYRESLILLGREVDAKIVDENDLPFINSVWRKHNERPVTSDISEIAHYEAMLGDKQVAIKLIDDVIAKEGANGFKLYYKGLATGDKSLFMQSIVHFTKQNGKFYANLPYQYVKDDPTFAPIANLLLNG
ncbi:AimR family lysis-lysogeny pheromone receptor [Neobacillus sp. 19]|uniref:AimR family lysis-lysogeny pheromone receptor n=1 Tax=Neobacillus sp. 19 TaxID=3394458 RepID=UPI003BF749D4